MKKIRVGVVGTGYLGKFHAEKYAQLEDADLVGIADIMKERVEALACQLNVTPYTDYKELFDKVDAVSIVTPTETHFEIGKAFLSRAIDVLIEKPITITTEEADDLIKESEKSGAILQVGHLERFNPAVMALKARVKNPMFIESHRLSQFVPRALDVDVVLDLMIHDIDIILNLVNSDVDSIDAVGIPVISGKVDIANARIRFKNGCVANVTASRVSKEKLRRIRLFQSNAYISIDYAAQAITVSKLLHAKNAPYPEVIEEKIELEKKDSLKEEIKSFIACSIGRTEPLVGGRDAKRALEVAQAIQLSVERSLEGLRRHIEMEKGYIVP